MSEKNFFRRNSNLTWGDMIWAGIPLGLAIGLVSLWLWEGVVRPWIHG